MSKGSGTGRESPKHEVLLSDGTQRRGERGVWTPVAISSQPSGLSHASLKRGSVTSVPRRGRLLPLGGQLGGPSWPLVCGGTAQIEHMEPPQMEIMGPTQDFGSPDVGTTGNREAGVWMGPGELGSLISPRNLHSPPLPRAPQTPRPPSPPSVSHPPRDPPPSTISLRPRPIPSGLCPAQLTSPPLGGGLVLLGLPTSQKKAEV